MQFSSTVVQDLGVGQARKLPLAPPWHTVAFDMVPFWRQSGAMDLTPYVDQLRRDLAIAAAAGGEEATAMAERLTAPLESSARLVLLGVLSRAAADITRELAPGSVEVRLRGLDPEFVVSAAEQFPDHVPPGTTVPADRDAVTPGPTPEDDVTSRINLRLPESLKIRIEDAAAVEGLSVNAWLVRAASAALRSDQIARSPGLTHPSAGQRFTGWVR